MNSKKRTHRWSDGVLATLGKNAGYVTLIIGVLTFGDKSFLTPAVQKRALPIIKEYDKSNAARLDRIEAQQDKDEALASQRWIVLMEYQRASMTKNEIYKAHDAVVNNDSIIPELKNP